MAYYRPYHPPADPALVRELTATQNEMRQRVRLEPLPGLPKLIAGLDSSFPTPDTILSVIVVLTFPGLELVEKVYNYGPVDLPYVPGFLSFREAPNLLLAYEKLTTQPDVLMVDGHGIAHPRRMGIGAHIGVLLDKPSLGVAKEKLTGDYQEPAEAQGSRSPLLDKKTGELIGEVLRSKERVKPLFVSPGHRLDQATATTLALRCLRGYKLPEPTRLADHWAEQFKKEVR
ncbi:deoxyribonuclease V [Hymenobacter busanensis]|uniref:Endonuclease V n=1 Tax=Hymenobacter busanensis TaxID=2607656 RepID=A0A7L4ZVV1_9BACT|nr:deoxyribonuclease V [Hymenobacter busanensis]KAA9332053.1 deoxyribonuclease V [Hymenobacter busanensis]QHJ07609.1 deoxyribonuclease V [Hymenobacter busanensis]